MKKHHAIAVVVAVATILSAIALYLVPAHRLFGSVPVQYASEAPPRINNTSGPASCPAGGVNGTDFLIIATHEGFNGSVPHGSPIHPWPILCVREGSTVRIEIVNQDPIEAHGFAIDNYFGAGVALSPGDSYSLTFAADKAGNFELYCNIFCSIHPFMVGEVIIYS